MRRQVFKTLTGSSQAMGAYELIDALAALGHKRLAPISVYRTLDFLLEAGLVHKIESRNAFVACPHLHAADEVVIFMICESCGRVQEATSDAVTKAIGDVAKANRFTLKSQIIEMQGRCGACGNGAAMVS
jgi:Fur family zinc uptake transcriptional regulator